MAYKFAKEGKKVTIVEMADTILNVQGLSASNYNMLMEIIDVYKIKVLKSAEVEKFENGKATIIQTEKNYPNVANRAKGLVILGPQGEKHKLEIPADHVVVSVGYISDNTLYEEIKADNVHLIGDAKAPANIMEAIWAAYEIAMKI